MGPDIDLKQLEHLPDGFLQVAVRDLQRLLPSPSLIHLPGRQPEPLFVSILLHGNETTGLLAVQRLLAKYRGRLLPRALSLFVGNVAAASLGLRRLEGQPDYNRIWPGTELPDGAEVRLARRITGIMAARGVYASVDVHNNTGLNPHYACVTRLDDGFLQLAQLFGRLVVYFRYPKGVQCDAFADLCPALTLECGKPGQPFGVEHTADFLEACLRLSALPRHPPAAQAIDLFHTVAQVKVRDDVSFGFGPCGAELVLDKKLESLNFSEMPAGTVWGSYRPGGALPFAAMDEAGADLAERYFALSGGKLVQSKAAMPSMLTLDERVIRQDCLCYLMERLRPC